MFAGRAGMAGGILPGGWGISIPQGGVCHAQCGPCAGCAAVHRGVSGQRLALRVAPGGRVLALLFCSPGAAFTLWQQAGMEPPQAQPAAALAESSESPPQPTPEPSVQPTPSPTPQPTAEPEATPAPTITIPPGVQTTAPILDRTFGQGSGQGYIALAAGSIKMQRMNQIQPLPPRRRERCPLPLPPAARTRRC